MITAKNAREIVNKVEEMEIERERRLAAEFCEELSKKIEEMANKKICNYIFEIPNGIAKRSYVVNELRSNGYQTKEIDRNKVEIMW